MLPANLGHLCVRWRTRNTYDTSWVTPGHDCLWSCACGQGAAVRPQNNNSIWDGVIGLWCRVARLLSQWCAKGEVPTAVNLNWYAVLGSHISLHCDNKPLFGPQNSPKLIVSMSYGLFCGVPGAPSRSGCCAFSRFNWTMGTSWSSMVWLNRSMCIAWCLACRVPGLTLRSVG